MVQIHHPFLGVFHTFWMVLVTTFQPVLVKQDIILQTTSPAFEKKEQSHI